MQLWADSLECCANGDAVQKSKAQPEPEVPADSKQLAQFGFTPLPAGPVMTKKQKVSKTYLDDRGYMGTV